MRSLLGACVWTFILFACDCVADTGKTYSYGNTTLTVFEPDLDGGTYSGKVISLQDSGEL